VRPPSKLRVHEPLVRRVRERNGDALRKWTADQGLVVVDTGARQQRLRPGAALVVGEREVRAVDALQVDHEHARVALRDVRVDVDVGIGRHDHAVLPGDTRLRDVPGAASVGRPLEQGAGFVLRRLTGKRVERRRDRVDHACSAHPHGGLGGLAAEIALREHEPSAVVGDRVVRRCAQRVLRHRSPVVGGEAAVRRAERAGAAARRGMCRQCRGGRDGGGAEEKQAAHGGPFLGLSGRIDDRFVTARPIPAVPAGHRLRVVEWIDEQ
jgi:hypothetical protein